MTAATCKTCKLWGRYRKGECDRVGDLVATHDPATMFDLEFGALDDTDVYARLMTGPDFGCIHHAPKNPRT